MYNIPPEFNKIILDYRNHEDEELAPLVQIIRKHVPQLLNLPKEEQPYMAARLAYFLRCLEAAESIGIEVSLDAGWDSDGIPIVEGPVHGDEQGKALAQKYSLSFNIAQTMYDPIDYRKEKECVIAFMGADNTPAWNIGGTYWVVAAWAPFEEKPITAPFRVPIVTHMAQWKKTTAT